MKKATNIDELEDNFDPLLDILQENENDFYVPIYDTFLKTLTHALRKPKKRDVFFIAGQSGNGKTTALRHLLHTNETIKTNYHTFYIGKEFLKRNDHVSVIDLLIMIGFSLTQHDEVLEKTYLDKLFELRNIHEGLVEKSETASVAEKKSGDVKGELAIGSKFFSIFSSKLSFISNFSTNDEVKKDARLFFEVKKSELVNLINEMILDFDTKQNDSKKLLIVMDDIEKAKYEDVKTLFNDDLKHILAIDAVKIMMMPVYVKREGAFKTDLIKMQNIHEFSIKLQTKENKNTQTYIEENIVLLRSLIHSRIDQNFQLISDDVIQQIVYSSGGNLRELVKIVNTSAFYASFYENTTVTQRDLEKTKEQYSTFYSEQIKRYKTLLQRIHNEDFDEIKEQKNIADLLSKNLIFSYFNGSTWYDTYPLLNEEISATH
jgi:hypothetical protein